MTKASAKLHDIILPAVLALGYELVGCVQFRQGRGIIVRVYIDKEGGITLDDCQRVSHQISGVLEVADPIPGEYNLEVSSPGDDRPLFTIEHFKRFIGHQVRLRLRIPLHEQRNFTGVIQNVNEDKVVLQLAEEAIMLPFTQIERANLIPDSD